MDGEKSVTMPKLGYAWIEGVAKTKRDHDNKQGKRSSLS
jgi:hypothetical protein